SRSRLRQRDPFRVARRSTAAEPAAPEAPRVSIRSHRRTFRRGRRPARRGAHHTDSVAVRRRILVVEDDFSTRHLLGVILNARGYEVALASDAEEGLRFLRE